MPKTGFFILLAIVAPAWLCAQSFQFNNTCKAAYTEILQLDFEAGNALIAQEKAEHPDNLVPILLESYRDFLQVYILQDEQAYARLEKEQEKRINTLQKGDKQSPYYLYTQAELSLHSASAHLTKQEFLAAFFDIRKAYKLLERNIAIHPDFLPNQKSFATLKATLGFVPGKYKWGLWLFGMEGNLNDGMASLKQLVNDAEPDNLYHKELVYTYSLLLFHLENKKEEAWQVAQKELLPAEGDPMAAYIAGRIALYSGHNVEAIDLLDNIYGVNIATTDYLLGIAYLNDLSLMAKAYFEKYLKHNTNGDLVKSSYHKLAWYYIIQGDEEQYVTYMNMVKTEGNTNTSADKQALKEAEDGTIPDADLLRARLLFDGGYYQKALAVLEEKEYQQSHLQLELSYRRGRIYHAITEESAAEQYYITTIETGQTQPYFYAANAALNLAQLYEQQGKKDKAKNYYNKALSLNGYEYATSIEQKAKAGLERIK